jgi:hypothetical protein
MNEPTNTDTALVEHPAKTEAAVVPIIHPGDTWAIAQRQAIAWSKSTIIPKEYQNNVSNCIVALEMASRIGASPMQVMQNLFVVQGRPGWSSTFLIASVNHCGRFTSLRYEERGETGGDTYAVRAWAEEKRTGERLNGTWITWEMVKAEGWLNKTGSKWKTMPDQMFKYRAASFWQRTYAPEISMGLHTVEEVEDIAPVQIPKGTTTVRFSVSQMAQAKAEIENAVTTAESILERFTNLAADQAEELKSYTFNSARN